jgi:hypothetical protein
MKKAECIKRYGEEEGERRLEQGQEYNKEHREEAKAAAKKYREEHKGKEEYREKEKAYNRKYQEENPEKVIANHQEESRKGGNRYDKHLKDNRTGLQGVKNRIRSDHRTQYKPYKDIIAPDSQIHHEWIPKTAEYTGLALVEAEQHMHGIVDVIEILDGEITLLTEEQIREG